MKYRVLFLGVVPTSYNDELLSVLETRCCSRLDRLYKGFGDALHDANGSKVSGVPYILRVLFRKYDLIWICGWRSAYRVLLAVVGRLLGVKVVIWTDTPRMESSILHGLRGAILSALAHIGVTFWGTGPLACKVLTELGIRSQSVKDYPYWAFPKVEDIPGGHARNKADMCAVGDGKVVIVCAGRLVRYKGFREVVLACALCSSQGMNLELKIAGDGPEKEELETLISSHGLTRAVSMHGHLANADLRALISKADLFVHAAIELEPYGVVVAEALMLGVPVIVSSLCGVSADRVQHGENGLILPGRPDAKAIATAIREIVQLPRFTSYRHKASLQAARWGEDRAAARFVENL